MECSCRSKSLCLLLWSRDEFIRGRQRRQSFARALFCWDHTNVIAEYFLLFFIARSHPRTNSAVEWTYLPKRSGFERCQWWALVFRCLELLPSGCSFPSCKKRLGEQNPLFPRWGNDFARRFERGQASSFPGFSFNSWMSVTFNFPHKLCFFEIKFNYICEAPWISGGAVKRPATRVLQFSKGRLQQPVLLQYKMRFCVVVFLPLATLSIAKPTVAGLCTRMKHPHSKT